MSDLTVFAESLISTVARAFYDDEIICLIDVLIRDKFLRDDDMAPRLNLPARKLRSTLQFLIEEHLVRSETVDDLAQGGSQATKFYYIDYNRAVHSIRLRIYLWKKKLQQEEIHARSQSYYLCPGYASRRCNGRYTEEEAQQMVNINTGLFLCQECYEIFENDPSQPSQELYTLKLVDNTKELRTAMDNLRRVNVQLSAKCIGNEQLRPGIYDLLQKVRSLKPVSGNANGIGSTNTNNTSVNGQQQGQGHQQHRSGVLPITSNLPSENFALGIGSKRLAGTGRTAGIKEKKLLQQGVAQSAAQARNYLVSRTDDDDDNNNNDDDGTGTGGTGGGANAIHVVSTNKVPEVNLLFLKNAMGNEIQFTIERGGAARAQLLVDALFFKNKYRRKRKLLDAAASRVGSAIPIPIRAQQIQQKKRVEAYKRQVQNQLYLQQTNTNTTTKKGNKTNTSATTTTTAKSKLMKVGDTFDFLKDNIGRMKIEEQERRDKQAAFIAAGGNPNDGMIDNDDDDDDDDDVDDIYDGTIASSAASALTTDGILNNSTRTNRSVLVLSDDTIELARLSDDRRLATFQAAYNLEMQRQETLLRIANNLSDDLIIINNNNNNNNNNNTILNGTNAINGSNFRGNIRGSISNNNTTNTTTSTNAIMDPFEAVDMASVVSDDDDDRDNIYVQWVDGTTTW